MAKARPVCPRCGKPVRSGSIDCPDVMIGGVPTPDPDGVTITLHPCGCTAGKADSDFPQFVNIVKGFFGVP